MTTLNVKKLIEASPLIQEAFCHKSSNKNTNFERLEFLGDSLIEAYVTEELYHTYPQKSEGDLSRWRSALVSQESLAKISLKWDLPRYLESKDNTSFSKNQRIQASLFESFVGAYYLTKGKEALLKILEESFRIKVKDAEEHFKKQDPKTLLQEKIQAKCSLTPEYVTLEREGPSHNPTFVVALKYGEKTIEKAKGASLKEAQKKAAKKALDKIEKEEMS